MFCNEKPLSLASVQCNQHREEKRFRDQNSELLQRKFPHETTSTWEINGVFSHPVSALSRSFTTKQENS